MSASTHVIDGELDLLAIQQTNSELFPFFLDSAAHGYTFELDAVENSQLAIKHKKNALGRYSILFAYPQETLCMDSSWRLHCNHELSATADTFLNALDEVWKNNSPGSSDPVDLPFQGGWFLFLAYELAQEIEPVLELSKCHTSPGSGLPVAFATRIPVAIIVDHVLHTTTAFAESGFESEFADLLDIIKQTGQKCNTGNKNQLISISEEDPEIYLSAIKRTKEYIYEGDVFQANLSREWNAKFELPVNVYQVYRQLRTSNPGPFAGMVFHQDHVIMSSSPERLLKTHGKNVSTRPIAGTRPRGNNEQDDEFLREELHKHPKERAEHIMLIDLERNDLGRISKAGSVVVDELMVIESYEHVHHIVSNVCGELREGITPGKAIKAVFPGGTITGCPKVRCMQIIAELEDKPREAYTGSMGYLNHNGDMDLNILIRTMHLHGSSINFRAGGGIVYDSNPEKELHETRAKARGLINALQTPAL